jgi:hypothetical protein
MRPGINRGSPKKRSNARPEFADYIKRSAIIAAVTAPTAAALANFSGDYSLTPPANSVYSNSAANGMFGNWTGTEVNNLFDFITLDTTGAPSSLTISVSFDSVEQYNFLVKAAATGLVSFDFSEFGGGVTFVDQTSAFSSSLTGSGMFSATVSANDIFGFQLSANYLGSDGITITNFSAPEPSSGVPDQGRTLNLLALGFVGLLAYRAAAARSAAGA